MKIVALGATLFFVAPVFASSPPPPKIYQKCYKCHGAPGDGGTKQAPDLAASKLDYVQFKKQVKEGSTWKGKPKRKWKYRHKKMPAQLGLTKIELQQLYVYIHTK